MQTLVEIQRLADRLATMIPHRFEVITRLPDGPEIPPEALSEDHSLGLYGEVVPYLMRQAVAGYRAVEVADLSPQVVLQRTPTGIQASWFLECPGLRGVRFRTERLQYLEDGWWATAPEVHYPAETVLAALHAVKALYGAAYLYLNTELPMPLWVRPAPLGEPVAGAQAVVQARSEGRVIPTNIHTECPMEYARRWAAACRTYYRVAE